MPQSDPAFILVTNEHLLNVKIAVRGQRLVDVLNDSTTSYLCVSDVRVFRKLCGTCVAKLPEAVVKKSNIALAMPIGSKHEAPRKRHDSFVSKKRHSVFLVVLGHDVRGEIALRGTDDPKTALCRELEGFFPVPNGTVTLAGSGDARQSAQVLIVNREYVSLFHVAPVEPGHERPSHGPEVQAALPPREHEDPTQAVVLGAEQVPPVA